MPSQFAVGSTGSTVPAEDIRASDQCSRRVCGSVRSDVSIVCVDTLLELVLSSGVCDTVPVCSEAGPLSVGAERPVSLSESEP